MPVESTFNFIDDFNVTWPNDNPDLLAQQAAHSRGIKNGVLGSFPNLGQVAVSKTAAEINDLATLTGTEILTNKTLTLPVINGQVLNADGTELDVLDGAVAGAAAPNKALIPDVNSDIAGVNKLTTNDLVIGTKSVNVAGSAYGGMVLLNESTPMGVPMANFESLISPVYSNYALEIRQLVPVSPSDQLAIRTSANNGGIYDANNGYYGWNITQNGTNSSDSGNASSLLVTTAAISNSVTAGGVSGWIWITNPLDSSAFTTVTGFLGGALSTASYLNILSTGKRKTAASVDAIQVRYIGGDIASGLIRFWGIV